MSSHQTAKEAEPGSGVRFDHPAEVDYKLTIEDQQKAIAVSYTHLTLPTNREV